ncbi:MULTISPECIES: hypothetical protein [Bacillus]|uniref:hypothetical protein n=1 Tax=Bacillus TaxID=1386 RepID=UPI00030C28FC|nr:MULTISPECIES: hypothetical protein [Bacillus]
MQKISSIAIKELESYRIAFSCESTTFTVNDWIERADEMISYTKKRINTDIPRVVASMWIRRYALFITAQFFMLSKYRLKWAGTLEDLYIYDDPNDEHWIPLFILSNPNWKKVEEQNITIELNQILKNFAAKMILPIASKTKTPKLVLWENIWGYTLWMYDRLLKESDNISQVEKDIELLLEKEVWNDIEKRSPFKVFLCFQSIPKAIQHYKRVTCCYYYEIEGQNKCPYCPTAGCSK